MRTGFAVQGCGTDVGCQRSDVGFPISDFRLLISVA